MIDPENRLAWVSGNLLNGGPYTWHFVDYDQRRFFSVTYDPPVPLEDEEEIDATDGLCMAQLQKHIDQLGHGVYGIRFSEPDGPIIKSTDVDDDCTRIPNNYPLTALKLSSPIKLIHLAKLTELDRLAPKVDLVSYEATPCVGDQDFTKTTTAVFKYWVIAHAMWRNWYEMNSWSRLPRDHPHIVPFDRVVLDHVRGGIVGFTSLYFSGGSLKDKDATTRTFRLEWFHQLLSVVEDLNYQYGIMHQDIAPRNLLIDEQDNLRIFDFDLAIMIDKHYIPERDDIKGVVFTLYEIITLDEHFRDVPHEKQDHDSLLAAEWTKHPKVKLDHPVQDFRFVLDAWISKRKGREFTVQDSWVRWPWMPDPPQGPWLKHLPNGQGREKCIQPIRCLGRQDLVKMGESFYNWERPAKRTTENPNQKQWRGS